MFRSYSVSFKLVSSLLKCRVGDSSYGVKPCNTYSFLPKHGVLRGASARLQALRPDDGERRRRGEDIDERSCGGRLFGGGAERGGERRVVLQFCRQRADVIDALDGEKLADLLDGNPGLAAGDRPPDQAAGLSL